VLAFVRYSLVFLRVSSQCPDKKWSKSMLSFALFFNSFHASWEGDSALSDLLISFNAVWSLAIQQYQLVTIKPLHWKESSDNAITYSGTDPWTRGSCRDARNPRFGQSACCASWDWGIHQSQQSIMPDYCLMWRLRSTHSLTHANRWLTSKIFSSFFASSMQEPCFE